MTPTGWLKVMAPAIGSFARKAITQDMQRFSAWVEVGPAAAGA
jgi:hypothetical protein